MTAQAGELDRLLAAIRSCRYCVEISQSQPLGHEPRPVLRASSTARLAVCSQAPGTKVHLSGTPFTDASGDRLRDWMGVSPQEFYDEARVAIVPMGFCFPGQDEKGPIFRRDVNARRSGTGNFSQHCLRSSSCSRSASTHNVFISVMRREPHCKRRCSPGDSI
jgi:uracil-DNA glycosylase